MAFDLNNLEYLALEGGGGRGMLYIEPLRILENRLKSKIQSSLIQNRAEIERYRKQQLDVITNDSEDSSGEGEGFNLKPVEVTSKTPLFQVNIPPRYRVLKGVSGSSAGAITAFMLSLGMSSDDIDFELGRTDLQAKNSDYNGPISVFEQFIDESPSEKYKRVVDNKPAEYGEYENSSDRYKLIIQSLRYLPLKLPPVFNELNNLAKIGLPLLYKGLRTFRDSKDTFSIANQVLRDSDRLLEGFIANIVGERGLFVGFKMRDYFSELIDTYLYKRMVDDGFPKPSIDPKNLTFREFFDFSGTDLVITGTNISQGIPCYFSVFHTPDFPVIEAVQLSMGLPGAFKPIYVNTEVINGQENSRNGYAGLYVDGGMLNNYPIRAFDSIVNSNDLSYVNNLTYRGVNLNNAGFVLAGDPFDATNDCDCILGIRLESERSSSPELREDKIYPTNRIVAGDFLSELYNTAFYPSEEGQLRSASDKRNTVKLYGSIELNIENLGKGGLKSLRKEKNKEYSLGELFSLDVSDFATVAIEEKRNRAALARLKSKMLEVAGIDFIDFLDNGIK